MKQEPNPSIERTSDSSMRRWSYFTVVLVTAAASTTLLALRFAAIEPSGVLLQRLFAFGHLFGSSLPLPLAQFVPGWLTVVLGVVAFLLSARRLWQMAALRAIAAPASLGIWPFRLLVVALASFLLCVASIAVAHITGRSQLVPIGFILGWPAAMLLAPIMTYVEANDVWHHSVSLGA